MMAPNINVFVTGFGPYPTRDGGQHEVNTSHSITKLLPSVLNPYSSLNPTAACINILNPTSADGQYVKTEYKYIREYVKAMHQQYSEKDIDLFVHVGMASGWGFVSVERVAYRQGMSSSWWSEKERQQYYLMPDNSGNNVADLPNPWLDIPAGLQTVLDVDAVVEGAQALQQVRKTFAGPTTSDYNPTPIRVHQEGGPYCCGFIHYESLANCYVNKTVPRVMFIHVPGETADPADLEKGRDAVVAIISSAVNNLLQKRAAAEATPESFAVMS